jgi:hypothetical protein
MVVPLDLIVARSAAAVKDQRRGSPRPPVRELRHRVALVRLWMLLRNRIHAIAADHGHGRSTSAAY